MILQPGNCLNELKSNTSHWARLFFKNDPLIMKSISPSSSKSKSSYRFIPNLSLSWRHVFGVEWYFRSINQTHPSSIVIQNSLLNQQSSQLGKNGYIGLNALTPTDVILNVVKYKIKSGIRMHLYEIGEEDIYHDHNNTKPTKYEWRLDKKN